METEQPQTLPPVEPIARFSEGERKMAQEYMLAHWSALALQQQTAELQAQHATLLGAYQKQSQELTAARAQIEALKSRGITEMHATPAQIGAYILNDNAQGVESPEEAAG